MTDYTKEKAKPVRNGPGSYNASAIAGADAAFAVAAAAAAAEPAAAPGAANVPDASAAPNASAALDSSAVPDAAAAAGRAPRTRRNIGRALLIILITVTIALIITSTPIFSISTIEVHGNNYYSNSAIISKSGLRAGQNGFSAILGGNIIKILTFRCAPSEQAIASACPYVKTIQVHYILPRTIRIDIEERNSSFIVPYFGSGLLIDGEGIIVDIVRDYRQYDLPVAQGLPVERYDIGKAIAISDDSRINAVLSVISAIKQADRDSEETMAWDVASIDVGDLRQITISMINGIRINLGDATDLYYRVIAAKEIISCGIEEGEKGLIIFSNGARPVFVPDNLPGMGNS